MFSSFRRDKRVQSTGQLSTSGAIFDLPVHIQSVVLLQLVRCTSDELELLNWDAEGLEYSFEEEGVVFCPVLEGLEGGFVGVEETVQLQVSPSGGWMFVW
jgi:hypothetical protein